MAKLSKKERKILRRAAKIMRRLAGDYRRYNQPITANPITELKFETIGGQIVRTWTNANGWVSMPVPLPENSEISIYNDGSLSFEVDGFVGCEWEGTANPDNEIEYTQSLDIPLLIHDNPMPNIRDGMYQPPSIRRLGKDGWV